MRNLNVYQGGEEYAQDNLRAYPAVSLIYDNQKPNVIVTPETPEVHKGVFIETIAGDLVKKEDWNRDIMFPNCIYVSDGIHKVRLALTWCNESNCNAVLATSNGNEGMTPDDQQGYMDNGQGDEIYGEVWCRAYRWTSGYNDYYPWQELIDGISVYNSYDWDGKKNTQIIKHNFDIKNFPAFHACTTYHSPNGEEGYLMGVSEWQFVFKYADEIAAIDELLGLTNPNMFGENGIPWTSSLFDEGGAWYLNTRSFGILYRSSRYNDDCVRAAF